MEAAPAAVTAAARAAIIEKVKTELVITAADFGRLYGQSQSATGMMIHRGAFPLKTHQMTPRGRHYVSTQAVREYFANAGIQL